MTLFLSQFLSHSLLLSQPKNRVVWLSFQPPAHLLDRASVWSLVLSGDLSLYTHTHMLTLTHRWSDWLFEWRHGTVVGWYLTLSLPSHLHIVFLHIPRFIIHLHSHTDFQRVRPTLVTATPRFWSLLYTRYHTTLTEFLQRGIGRERDGGSERGGVKREGEGEEEERAMKEIRELLGGRVRMAVSGAALISPALIDFLQRFLSSLSLLSLSLFSFTLSSYMPIYSFTTFSGVSSAECRMGMDPQSQEM